MLANIIKISTLGWGNNRRIPRRLSKGKLKCCSHFYCETNTGKMLRTEYWCTSYID